MKRAAWVLCCAVLGACASHPGADRVRARLQEVMPGTPVDEVRPAPMAGVWEVRSGRNLFYTVRGRYLLVGHIYDPKRGEDLTAKRLAELDRVDFARLPLSLAVVSGPKDARLRLAVFDDPDCPYCRRLERWLSGMRDVRVYRFLFPLESLHPNARRHAEAIWCAGDRMEALRAVMLEGKDLSPPAGCDAPVDEIAELGGRLGVMGTPTLIAGDGRVLRGLPASVQALRAWLEGGK